MNDETEQFESAGRGGLNRNRDFLKLWAGETVSDFGSYIGSVSISFAAVIALKASPAQMGLLAAAGSVPSLLFSLLAGVWVDRLRRRPLMIAADIGRFALLATIPVAAVAGVLRMWLLVAVMLAASVLDLVFVVAYRSYLPSLVEREQLIAANSRLTASSSIAEVAGFGLAGWIVQWLTAPFAIGIDAVSFLASALAIALVGKREPDRAPRVSDATVTREIVEGVRFVWNDAPLRAITLTRMLLGFTFSAYSTLYMLYVVNELGFKAGALGMLFAAGGASAFVASIAAGRLSNAIGVGRAMWTALLVQTLAMSVLLFARGPTAASIALILVQQIVGDAGGIIYSINRDSVVQATAPHRVIGRVNASIRFLHLSAVLVGQIVAGVTGARFGLRLTMAAGCVGSAVAAVLLAVSSAGDIRDLNEPASGAISAAGDASSEVASA